VEKNTAYAYLSIDEFSCPVVELTKRIGIQPTEAWDVGDVVPPVHFPRKYSAWRIQSRLPHSEDVERHIIDVLDQIRGYDAVFREIAREGRLRMQGVGYYNEYNPGFGLEPDVVRRLAECGMTVDMDAYQYFMGERDKEVDHDA
jgi:hypothetical protein